MSNDFKEKYYEEHSNANVEDKVLILKYTNDEFINNNFKELFDEFMKTRKEFHSFLGLADIRDIFRNFTEHEFNASTIQYLLDTVGKQKNQYDNIISGIFYELNPKNQIDYYKDFMQLGLQNGASAKLIASVFDEMALTQKKENFYKILEYAQSISPEVAHFIRGNGYMRMLHSIGEQSPKERDELIEKNVEEILLSLRTLYENPDYVYQDSRSPEEKKEFDKNYPIDFAKILVDMDHKGELNYKNVNIIIDNLPILGKEIINRVYQSNSDMIRANASQLISAVASLPKEDAISLIEDTERMFSKSTIPDFVKLYKFYDNVVERNRHLIRKAINGHYMYSPELQQSKTEREAKKIIFSDLLNISLKSNNKSLKNFLDVLEEGNETYIKFLKNDRNLDSLTNVEKGILQKYAETLYVIYDETDASRIDKRDSKGKIVNTKNYIKTLDDMSKRYIGGAFPTKLSDTVLDSVIGRFDVSLTGKRTIDDFKRYMEECNQQSNKRHEQLEKVELVLEPGDLIKGITGATDFLQSLFSNGIRAGEFLGVDNHTDATPLDSDHSLILPSTVGTSLSSTISNTTSGSYGNFHVVIKKNSNKIQYTRDNPEYVFNGEESPSYRSTQGINVKNEPENIRRETIKARIDNRINDTYEEPKLEAFSSNFTNNDHYGIRTGMAITDVDYIVVEDYDKRIGYELAMNGTFIPVIDRKTEAVVFGKDDYDKIREQMQGLSFFDAKKFEVSQSAYIDKAEEKVMELFPDGNVEKSIAQVDASTKRNAIEEKVRQVILDKFGLGFKKEITGDITPRIYRIYRYWFNWTWYKYTRRWGF